MALKNIVLIPVLFSFFSFPGMLQAYHCTGEHSAKQDKLQLLPILEQQARDCIIKNPTNTKSCCSSTNNLKVCCRKKEEGLLSISCQQEQ